MDCLRVYCSMKGRGCDWSGMLGQLDTHLDPDQNNCQHVDIKCPLNCQQTTSKNMVEQHLAMECIKRDYVCQYCNFNATYDVIVKTHWPVCIFFPIQCPNFCGVTCERDVMKDHMSMCCLEEVACEFSGMGCDKMFRREDQEEHIRQNSLKHLSMTAAASVKINQKLQQKLLEEETKLQKQEGKLQEQEGKLQEQEKKQQEQEGKLQEQEGKLQEQEGKLQEQEKKQQEQEGKLQEQEGKLQKQEGKLQEQEGKLQEQEEKLQEQEGKLQEQEEKLQEQENKLQEQEEKLKEQEGKLQEQEQKLKDSFEELEERFTRQGRELQEEKQKNARELKQQEQKTFESLYAPVHKDKWKPVEREEKKRRYKYQSQRDWYGPDRS